MTATIVWDVEDGEHTPVCSVCQVELELGMVRPNPSTPIGEIDYGMVDYVCPVCCHVFI